MLRLGSVVGLFYKSYGKLLENKQIRPS